MSVRERYRGGVGGKECGKAEERGGEGGGAWRAEVRPLTRCLRGNIGAEGDIVKVSRRKRERRGETYPNEGQIRDRKDESRGYVGRLAFLPFQIGERRTQQSHQSLTLRPLSQSESTQTRNHKEEPEQQSGDCSKRRGGRGAREQGRREKGAGLASSRAEATPSTARGRPARHAGRHTKNRFLIGPCKSSVPCPTPPHLNVNDYTLHPKIIPPRVLHTSSTTPHFQNPDDC